MTRDEHLAWCKLRALQYVDAGDMAAAFASLSSDLGKHDGTQGAKEINDTIGFQMMFAGLLARPDQMREWINGFN